ncbi:hypothetical protein MSPP1_002212 [Malassezia sp. CBS 17886]|nr:hypothetical protein MSPP1_002212 [Malassezia sp. CBS 17886]
MRARGSARNSVRSGSSTASRPFGLHRLSAADVDLLLDPPARAAEPTPFLPPETPVRLVPGSGGRAPVAGAPPCDADANSEALTPKMNDPRVQAILAVLSDPKKARICEETRVIETPDFRAADVAPGLGKTRGAGPLEDTSDDAYTQRHLRHERAEKKLRRQEREVLTRDRRAVVAFIDSLTQLDVHALVPALHARRTQTRAKGEGRGGSADTGGDPIAHLERARADALADACSTLARYDKLLPDKARAMPHGATSRLPVATPPGEDTAREKRCAVKDLAYTAAAARGVYERFMSASPSLADLARSQPDADGAPEMPGDCPGASDPPRQRDAPTDTQTSGTRQHASQSTRRNSMRVKSTTAFGQRVPEYAARSVPFDDAMAEWLTASVPPGALEAHTSHSDHRVPSPGKLKLTPDLVASMKPAKVFRDFVQDGCQVTSLNYDDRGELCVTASNDETIQLYNCRSGKCVCRRGAVLSDRHTKTLYSKKYGVNLARFTHRSSAIIYASTKEDDTIRYHSLHDNKYLQYFRGHKRRVVSLEMSPVDDTFLSGAVDDAVRLWDLRSPAAQGNLRVQGHPVVAYDPSGAVFAVAINERPAVLLYDVRKFDQSPFLTVGIDDTAALSQVSMPPRIPVITHLSFSQMGQYILAGTSGDVHYIIDSFSGDLLFRLVGHEGLERADGAPIGMVAQAGISGQELCWSPDGQMVIAGSANGHLYAWTIPSAAPPTPPVTLGPSCVLEGHDGTPRVVAFNPRCAELSTAGAQVAFWLPDVDRPA